MCVWPVKEEDRLCHYCVHRWCKDRRRPTDIARDVCNKYAQILKSITGVDVLADTRKREVVWGRNMIAYKMYADGFTQEMISFCVGRNRCSIVHCIKSMEDMLDNPRLFWKEYEIWTKFVEQIS